jgi:protease-4
LLHQEIALLARHKPVVACFGTVAASGGYYVAAPAHAIVAEPLTITGSIGVLMAKLVAQPLLERLGIRTETIRTKAGADMFSSARALTAEERAVLAREADSFYAAFVNVVAAGRGKSFDTIEALARGRVWSGQDAYDKGLVDVLGGLDTALEEVRRRLSNTRPKERDALEALVVPASDDNHLFPTPILPPQAQALTDLAWLGLSRDRALYYALNIPWIP